MADIPKTEMDNPNAVKFVDVVQVILARTLTGIQGDIRSKVLATLSKVK